MLERRLMEIKILIVFINNVGDMKWNVLVWNKDRFFKWELY